MNRLIRQKLRLWRRSSPFIGALLTTAAGAELVGVVLTAPGLLSVSGAAAPASWLLGVLLIVAGLTTLSDPRLRHFAGAVAIVCGLLSLVLSNLGGLLAGCLLALVGGALTLAWVPAPDTGTGEPAEISGHALSDEKTPR
ncbi:DUF6114 domain-containing protein [Lentzea sp. NPDC004789]